MNLEEMFLQMAAGDLVVPNDEEFKAETQAPARVGRAGQAAAPQSIGQVVKSVGETLGGLSDIPAAAAKGAVQGFAGLPGDIEGIGRLLLGAMGVNVEESTALPTTEEIKQFLDERLGKVGTGDNPFETVGEFMAPGGYTKAVKASAQGAKKVAGAVKETLATPPRGSVQLAPQGAPKSEIGFYSAVEDTVANIQQAKGSGAQFLAQISKTQGVKPEELKWTGLDEFLKGKKSVTKAEIQDYLASNKVDVQEVRSTIPRLPGEEMPGDQGSFLPKFASYQLPGGENYREILLTLPTQKPVAGISPVQAARVLFQKEYGQLTQEQKQEVMRLISDDTKSPSFISSHWSQPNVLAHIRMNDRTDADGNRVLFIEEIQSDWHQAGRKKGYQQPPNESRVTEINQKLRELAKSDLENTPEWDILTREKESLTGRTGVPDAPFKTSWHELSLKRAIQEASEKGYDKIAFTTGRTQAERYDLSKQLDKVKVRRFRDEWVVEGYKGNAEVLGRSAKNDEELSALIGKDLAEKAIKDNGGSYSGIDLQVGGEGMKGFYDNILPKSLEKLGKKFDAKVDKTTMDGTEVWSMDITPKMRESVTSKGQPLFVAAPVAPAAMQDEENK